MTSAGHLLLPTSLTTYELEPCGHIGPAVQALARTEIAQIIGAFRTLNADTLNGLAHEIRQQLKRLRALLSLVREPLGKKCYEAEDGVIREAEHALGTMREAQALLTTLDGLQRRFFPDNRLPVPWLAMREKFRTQAQQCAATLVGSDIFEKQIACLQTVGERVATWPIADYGWKEMRCAVRRIYQCSREDYKHSRDDADTARLHRWRKRANDLSLYLQMLRHICPVPAENLLHDFHVLGECLGNDHDLVALRAAVEKQRDSSSAHSVRETFLKLLDLRREELLSLAFELGERLHVEPPAVFIHELGNSRGASRRRTRLARELTDQLSASC